MVLNQLVRAGLRSLAIGAALHGLSTCAFADDVQPAGFETSNVSRSKQVSPVAHQASEGCGVAKVPGCASGACTNGGMKCGAAGCGPQGCTPGTGWGPCSCPSCRASRHNGQPSLGIDLYSFHDVGQAMRSHTFGWAMPHAEFGPQTDWGDEMGNAPCPEHGQMQYPHCCGWWDDQCALFHARNREQGAILRAHIHGKLAYFHPMGNGGEGAPPFGCYHLVYAANPSYCDPRDSQVYAAQGWGVPISVPLAPTVRHTMNYSTGIPSSRLTPISNVVPPRGRRGW